MHLKNIYVIQKCASCGYTKEQCDYVFEELKSMKIVDTKPESATFPIYTRHMGNCHFIAKKWIQTFTLNRNVRK